MTARKSTHVPPGSDLARLLQALRAGPHDATQLQDRFDERKLPIADAKRCGYIEQIGQARDACYRITPAGLSACPARRDDPGPSRRVLAELRPRSMIQMQKVGAPAVAASNIARGKRTFDRVMDAMSEEWMSVMDIMGAADISETSTKRLMDQAVEKGLVEREKRLINGRHQYAFRRTAK